MPDVDELREAARAELAALQQERERARDPREQERLRDEIHRLSRALDRLLERAL